MSAETAAPEAVESAPETEGAAAKSAAAAVEDARARAEAWIRDSGEKARDAALKATEDLKAAGTVAIEGEMACNARMLELARTLVDSRAAAAAAALQAGDLREAMGIEQAHAKEAMEALSAGLREISEIRFNTYKDAVHPFTARASEALDAVGKA